VTIPYAHEPQRPLTFRTTTQTDSCQARHAKVVIFLLWGLLTARQRAAVSTPAHGREIERTRRPLGAEAVVGSQVDRRSLDRPAEAAEGSTHPDLAVDLDKDHGQ
jgi:hypothetical protein